MYIDAHPGWLMPILLGQVPRTSNMAVSKFRTHGIVQNLEQYGTFGTRHPECPRAEQYLGTEPYVSYHIREDWLKFE